MNGRTTGLLELGTGFNPEFTGLQNIFFNGTLLGMSKDEINGKLDAIIAFSELDEFIDESIKTYSSGMVMRLAFSVAIHADPQAFVVDEALSVGDAYFQQKCMRKIREFKKEGGSIVFVSHDMNAVKVLCDKAILLDSAATVEEGNPEQVINTYNFLLAKKAKGEEIRLYEDSAAKKEYGNLKVMITKVNILDELGDRSSVLIAGKRCAIEISVTAHEKVNSMTIGILLRDKFGQDIFGTNTYHQKIPIELGKGQRCNVKYNIDELNIGCGKYTLSVAAHKGDTHIEECYQWMDAIKSFEVVGPKDFSFVGICRLTPSITVGFL